VHFWMWLSAEWACKRRAGRSESRREALVSASLDKAAWPALGLALMFLSKERTMARQMPTYADVVAARARIGALACRTPLVEHPALNAITGGRVLLKAENLQRVGAFKFRGAYNKV